MKRALLLLTALAACGGDPEPLSGNPMTPTPTPAPPPAMMPSGLGADAANRVFEINEALVFGVNSNVRLSIGIAAGAPLKAPFTIRSTGNSDEAKGELSFDPCAFQVTESSFPPNSRLRTGLTLPLSCSFDAAAKTLILRDPATNASNEGTLCEVVGEDIRC